jgi:hypothetical protein
MAKKQTFGDKSKKVVSKPVIKVVKGYRSEEGSVRFLEQFVKVDDLAVADKIDINR